MEIVPNASAAESIISAQEITYPNIFCVSGLFWQKFNPDIDHWNEIENIGLMLSWKDQVLSKGCEYKSRTCEMCSEIHNCR